MMAASPMRTAPAAGRRWGPRLLIGVGIAIGLLVFALANAHLVYVAITSQPDCVDHLKERSDSEGSASFRAARSAC